MKGDPLEITNFRKKTKVETFEQSRSAKKCKRGIDSVGEDGKN